MLKKIAFSFSVLLLPSISVAVSGYSALHNQIEQQFLSNKEPIALDAAWVTPTIFKIGAMRRNSINYIEYADYVCKTMKDRGLIHPGLRVKIINLPRLMTMGDLQILAEQNCAT